MSLTVADLLQTDLPFMCVKRNDYITMVTLLILVSTDFGY